MEKLDINAKDNLDLNLNLPLLEFQNYFDMEKELIKFIDVNLKNQFIIQIQKLKENEKNYFNMEFVNEIKINWIININTVQKNRGDICSSSLQKFYNNLYIKLNDNNNNNNNDNDINNNSLEDIQNDYSKFKTNFNNLFQIDLITLLNKEIQGNILGSFINKFEIKNGFLNVYFSSNGKNLLEKIKEKNNIDTQSHDNSFTVINIFYLLIYILSIFSI
jgi:hypothetical protein